MTDDSISGIIRHELHRTHNKLQYTALLIRPFRLLTTIVVLSVYAALGSLWIGLSLAFAYATVTAATPTTFLINSFSLIIAVFGLGNVFYLHFDEMLTELYSS